MAEELEELWKKLTFTEEEDTGIELDSGSTRAARKVGKYCAMMKILSQRSINVDALRKNLRMLWKPNKGVQISEIEEELFLVEFGDEKDKKKVLDMCPWSYEKQLILIQEYEGELTPKEIEMKWAPFWVQIYNLPLNSRTKETGWAIGSCLGSVLDVDVNEAGVQWSKCLRVRVRLDVTKRLARGKKISTEGGESKWVNFMYERLPNFCYRCGFLDHSLKECRDGQPDSNKEGEGQLQYGAWLRGEPMRRGRQEGSAQGTRRDMGESSKLEVGIPPSTTEQRYSTRERTEGGKSHVPDTSIQVACCPIRDVGAATTPELVSATLREEGKVKRTEGKIEEKVTDFGRFGGEKSGVKPGMGEEMQWGKDGCQGSEVLSGRNLGPSQEVVVKEDGPEVKTPEGGPLAFSFDDNMGWTSEVLSPTSRHWKRLARENNKQAQGTGSPNKGKRVGPTPLQELDPNSGDLKRRKGSKGGHEKNGEEKKVGGVAVAAVQHRRAK
ncbi:uncharacterized protein LOC142634866 [Castanea sativa]|uniref:uncharacterized protein LOC142634866 n=1 Tax=Castanea sativa TaxID=21020 RepID=UPI003F64AEC9